MAHSNYAFELRRTDKKEALKQFHIAQYLNEGSAFPATNVNAMIKLIGMNPDKVADRLVLAESAKSNDDLYGAVVEYRAALHLKNDSQTHKKLGDIYNLLGDKRAGGG